jgi:hypothetical protein
MEVSIPSAATVASEARHGGVRLAPPLALDLNEVDDLGPSASKLSEIGANRQANHSRQIVFTQPGSIADIRPRT